MLVVLSENMSVELLAYTAGGLVIAVVLAAANARFWRALENERLEKMRRKYKQKHREQT